MSRFRTSVKPIQEAVMIDIDEKLTSTRFGTARIGHGKGSRRIRDALMVLSNFIRNVTASVALVGLTIARLERRVGIRTTGSRLWTVGVLGVGASKLIHKVGNDSVKVLPVQKRRQRKK
jgi:hypothetical protein